MSKDGTTVRRKGPSEPTGTVINNGAGRLHGKTCYHWRRRKRRGRVQREPRTEFT